MAAALERGRFLFSALFPEAGVWVPGPVLPAEPVAGEDLNAFYDRRGLHFFRGRNPATGALVHSGESPDIVAHEEGHAALDAVRPDLWDAPHFEAAAFHEAFGDLAAIFVAFSEPALVAAVLAETGGALHKSNLVSRVAEELAAAARASFGPGVALPDALRDAVNEFRYSDPKHLPSSAPAEELSAEPHSFCRVLTGACWDVLVALYLLSGGGKENADRDKEALTLAARETGRLFAAAAESAPVGAAFFERVARRMVRAAAGDALRQETVRDSFSRRELLSKADRERERKSDQDRQTRLSRLAAGEALSPDLVRAIQTRLGPDSEGEVLTRVSPSERVLRGRRKRDLFLSGRQYGPADGAAVEISDSFSFAFAEEGYLTASAAYPAADRDGEDARAYVRFLAERDRIAQSEKAPNALELFQQGKSYVVVPEEDGVRRLRRVWIARKALSSQLRLRPDPAEH